MSYEEYIKNKLFELWKKEAVRIEKTNGGWSRRKVSLGTGILKVQGLTKMQTILNTIEEFGIDMDMLDTMNPDYDELYKIYHNIQAYRGSVRFLKELKKDMARRN